MHKFGSVAEFQLLLRIRGSKRRGGGDIGPKNLQIRIKLSSLKSLKYDICIYLSMLREYLGYSSVDKGYNHTDKHRSGKRVKTVLISNRIDINLVD